MTEAGQLAMDDQIWHDGKVWWVATIGATGDVTFVDEPAPGAGQVQQLVLERHDEVTRAGMALMDARGALEEATTRMVSRRYGRLDFEMAAERARKARRVMETLENAGVTARYEP